MHEYGAQAVMAGAGGVQTVLLGQEDESDLPRMSTFALQAPVENLGMTKNMGVDSAAKEGRNELDSASMVQTVGRDVAGVEECMPLEMKGSVYGVRKLMLQAVVADLEAVQWELITALGKGIPNVISPRWKEKYNPQEEEQSIAGIRSQDQ